MNFLLANPRIKKWVKEILDKREAIGRAIGMPLEEMLGCGHWGCVVDSSGPWVVKLTIDPNEAPIWEKITSLVEEEGWGGEGVVRVKGIYQLQPGVTYGGRMKKVYAIVREAVDPVFTEQSGRGLLISERTRAELGIHSLEPIAYVQGYKGPGSLVPVDGGWEVPVTDAVREFVITMHGLLLYRESAHSWYQLPRDRYMQATKEQLKDRIERINYSMGGYIGNAVGETLNMLLGNGIVLRDLHLFNIGWRKHSRINGSEMQKTICIFDPGHTPIGRSYTIPVARVENPYLWSR